MEENNFKNWKLNHHKVIIINPTKIKFDPGELMKFNGTALPNQSIRINFRR